MANSTGRFDRRTFLAMAGLAAPAALAACGSSPAAPAPAVRGTPGIGTGTPKRGGTLTFGVSSEIDGFNPWSSHFDATGIVYANAVFDTLTKTTRDGGWVPYLAQAVTPNVDRTQWTIRLRSGVVFHDGSPLDADVALANLHQLQTSLLTAQAINEVTSATKVDDLTYTITLGEPVAAFPFALSTQIGYIAAMSQIANPKGSQQPVGTGPFTFVDWVPNDHMTVKANPHYWRPGIPYLDSITFRPIVEDDARYNTLRSGGIDGMVSHDPFAIKDLRGNTSFPQVTNLGSTVGEPDMDFLIINCSKPPLDDLTVRQALAYGLNAAEIDRLFGAGIVGPMTSPFYEGSPYRSPNNHYPTYDPAKARQLVAQAKANHGGSISITLGTIPDPRLIDVTQTIQQMWSQVGIDVSLAQVQQAEFIDNLVGGSFDVYTDEQFAAVDPDLNYVWWSPTTANPPIALNFARNKDSRIETALQQGRTSPNPQVRAAAYQQVDNLLAEDLPYLWLSQAPWSMTTTDRIENFANPVGPDGTPLLGFLGGVFEPWPIWIES